MRFRASFKSGVVAIFVGVLAPFMTTGLTHAQTFGFAVSATIPVAANNLTGIDVDQVNKVVYALDEGNQNLIRIDGLTKMVVDSFPLPNCNDPRRPAVAHANGMTKIYLGCEDAHDVLVLQTNNRAPGQGLGPISVKTRIPLIVPGFTQAYEAKTERTYDAGNRLYVVGDNPFRGDSCNDPAFAISTLTDQIVATNNHLGTVGAEDDCGYTGINDVAVAGSAVFWFNEDDFRVYQTYPDLKQITRSAQLPNPCSEDAPKFGAASNVTGVVRVLATAPEAASCLTDSNFETGIIYSFANRLSLSSAVTTPNYSDGPVAASTDAFLVTNADQPCVQVRNLDGSLRQLVNVGASQVDIAFDVLGKTAWVTTTNNTVVALDGRGSVPAGTSASLSSCVD